MAADLKKKGRTTISWGTSNVVENTANVLTGGSLIVNRYRFKQRGFKAEVEDGDGAVAMLAKMKDGEEVEFVCVHDANANIKYPVDMDVVSLKSPLAAQASNYLVDDDPEVEGEKKREVTVTIRAVKYGAFPS